MDASSGRSAAAFLERLDLGFSPRSVLDVGCGRGVWLEAWRRRGVEIAVGVDGAYVDPATLRIPRDAFVAADLSRPLDLGRRFDLVECLEVAEHLDPSAADTLVASLVRHGDVVLFSAATPGQGGEHHVNEQPLTYWIGKFAAAGLAALDYPRAAVRGVRAVEPWYRYNALLFASAAGLERLSPEVRRTAVPDGATPREYAPLPWRVRARLLSALPPPLVHRLAQLKHLALRRRP
ncbi:MAG TPA: methyltransferase domain-containing protein [Anaeromyxobacter sp.]|nr:methyltransferase domain-containing protein [Anaeromyxobacter sp.]